MFKEQIAHGNDMIRRLEAERLLTAHEAEALPAEQHVPIMELNMWRQALEEKIKTAFGQDAFARYRISWDLYSVDVREEKDNFTPPINAIRRVVAYLTELENRPR